MQGEDISLGQTKRGTYGNSKVLAPANRTVKNAYMVSRWLVEKSAARLRRDEYTASQFSLFVSLQRPDGRWSRNFKTHHSQDTAHFLDLNRQLWRVMYDQKHPYLISTIGVHLGNILALSKRPAEMLLPLEMAQQSKREQLAKTIDTLNRRYGDRTVTFGVNKAHYGFFDRG
jgi:DNA polymerase-4